MKHKFIILSSIMAVITLYFIEQVWVTHYFVKTSFKIGLFVLIPLFFIKQIKESTVRTSLNIKKIDLKQIQVGLILGAISFLVVLLSYILLKDFIDTDTIINDLRSKGITPSTFIFIGLYITFVNAFLEEFFFRGYIFLNLYEEGKIKLAYLYSSMLFALYHIVIFQTWFNIYLIGLALIGLIVIGLVFNYIDTKSKNFLNSYIVHILADVAIILIGLRLFEII